MSYKIATFIFAIILFISTLPFLAVVAYMAFPFQNDRVDYFPEITGIPHHARLPYQVPTSFQVRKITEKDLFDYCGGALMEVSSGKFGIAGIWVDEETQTYTGLVCWLEIEGEYIELPMILERACEHFHPNRRRIRYNWETQTCDDTVYTYWFPSRNEKYWE